MSSDRSEAQDNLLAQVQYLVTYIESVYRAVLNRPPTDPEVEKYTKAMYQGLSAIELFHAINGSDERKTHAKLFAVPGSYQSPVTNPNDLYEYVDALRHAGPDLRGIHIDRELMVATWEQMRPFLTTSALPRTQTAGYFYYFQNLFFSFADAVVYQAMIRLHAPKRIIEIGSGFSSACAVDTVDRFLNGACELTFMEPFPERLFDVLGERARSARCFDVPVQKVPLDVFDQLEAGDILFIDSSHVLRTGSDVAFELFEILPRLPAGAIVHIHDIGWPFEYPPSWILQQNRSYNEAYAVRAYLTNNRNWDIVFFNDYFAKFEHARIKQTFPNVAGDFGQSLWLRRS